MFCVLEIPSKMWSLRTAFGTFKRQFLAANYENSRFLRFLSNRKTPNFSSPLDVQLISEEDKLVFDSFFPKIVEDVIDHKLITHIPESNQILKRVMEYNVPFGKKNRPHLLIAAYKFLMNNNLTEENIKYLNILGWCAEIMNSTYLIFDDVVDNTVIRRGQKTWFKTVGLNSIHDACLLDAVYRMLLDKYFFNHKNYKELVKIFMDAQRFIFVGQRLDGNSTAFEYFKKERYKTTAVHKTGYYTFTYPLQLAMALSDRRELQLSQVQGILSEIGIIYQIQNDFLDIYGETTEEDIGSDIQGRRCTWVIITALEHASPSQKKILEKYYGSDSPEAISECKKVFDELNIRGKFKDMEQESYQKASGDLKKITDPVTKKFFERFVQVYFKKCDVL